MGFIGQEIGSEVGCLIGSLVDKFSGSYVPFEKGGIIKPPKGQKIQPAIYIKEN